MIFQVFSLIIGKLQLFFTEFWFNIFYNNLVQGVPIILILNTVSVPKY